LQEPKPQAEFEDSHGSIADENEAGPEDLNNSKEEGMKVASKN